MYDDYSYVTKEFAERLRELRVGQNLTQSQLADALGVSRGAISYYEKAERTPDISFLVKSADFFRTSVYYLLGRTDNKNPENYDIGSRLGLSDKVIDFMERRQEFGQFLSDMIEGGQFESFYEICNGYLQERLWRYYRQLVTEDPVAYPTDIDELEDFRLHQISEIFSRMLKIEKIRLHNRAINKLSDIEISAIVNEEKNALMRQIEASEQYKNSLWGMSDAFDASDAVINEITKIRSSSARQNTQGAEVPNGQHQKN